MPSWIKYWEEWVQKTGNKEWARWLKKLKDPVALQLGKDWAEYLGYDAPSMVANSKIAPKVKPGVVINYQNYKDYPGLKDLLPSPLYNRLINKDAYGHIPEIRVVPTTHVYSSRGRLEATKKIEGQAKPDPQWFAKHWKGGIPFPRPKTGDELLWDYDRQTVGADNVVFNPFFFYLFDKNEKLERTYSADLWWENCVGRYDIDPRPVHPKYPDVFERGSIVFLNPFDIKGFAAVRYRYADPEKPDYFISWVPSLRRTRLFSGTDTQDPMFGTDVNWDDWKGFWQKISNTIYPLECKLVDENAEILAPAWRDYQTCNLKGNRVTTIWERRPCWVFDIISKDKSYVYSRRRVWLDKELFYYKRIEYYDTRGRFWRDWIVYHSWWPKTGEFQHWAGEITDYINNHRTIVKMNVWVNDITVNEDNFNLRALVRRAR